MLKEREAAEIRGGISKLCLVMDVVRPDWDSRVTLDLLDMGGVKWCFFAQVFRDEPWGLRFCCPYCYGRDVTQAWGREREFALVGRRRRDAPDLTRLWIAELAARRTGLVVPEVTGESLRVLAVA